MNEAVRGTAVQSPVVLGRPWRLPGVYRPQADTALLAGLLHREVAPGTDVLDIGTGSGALAVYAARLGGRVEAVDVSWRAVLTARINAARARSSVTVRRRDLCRPPGAETGSRTYDVVLSNPPYVPAPEHWRGLSGHRSARAWNGGPDGRDMVDALCVRAAGLLRPKGVLLMVHSGLCRAQVTMDLLESQGLEAEVGATARVPFGPVLRSRLPWLRAQGLLDAAERDEELVVIRAERR
jgi:release factor glutamine methyltransferase